MSKSVQFDGSDLDALEREAKDVSRGLTVTLKKINAMRVLFEMRPLEMSDLFEEQTPQVPPKPEVQRQRSMSELMLEVVERSSPIKYGDLRQAVKDKLAEERLGRKLTESNFHNSLKNLADRDLVVRHNGHAFTPRSFQEHERYVALGLKDDVQTETEKQRSRLYDDVPNLLQEYAGRRFAPIEIRDMLVRRGVPKTAFGKGNRSLHRILSRKVGSEEISYDEVSKAYFIEIDPTSKEAGSSLGENVAHLNSRRAPLLGL